LGINSQIGDVLYFARQYDRSIEQSRKTLEMDPNYSFAPIMMSGAYSQNGMYDQALTEIQRARELTSESLSESFGLTGQIHAASGNTSEAHRVLEHLM
jgi:tetratricopeptide (TPR) repeat protein